MRLSDLKAHAWMIRAGWAASDLDAMSEAEFLAALDAQTALEEELAEAQAQAMQE